MYKTFVFAKRNFKELARDVLTLVFTILLPVAIFLIMLFLTKQLDIPNSAFEIQNFTPATIIFSFSFSCISMYFLNAVSSKVLLKQTSYV